MKTLVKRNGFTPLVTTPFLPSVDAFFDDFAPFTKTRLSSFFVETRHALSLLIWV